MSGLYFLIPTLLAIAISMLVVRAGAIAFVLTGMNYEKAKFQALSAFSGTGFTTKEAESVVNHPQRRKIASVLMILGNAGIVAVIVTATSSFTHAKGFGIAVNLIVLSIAVGIGFWVLKHTRLIKFWETYSKKRLSRLSLFDEDMTLDEVLHVNQGYSILKLQIHAGNPLEGKSLKMLIEEQKNMSILGIENKSGWFPVPDINWVIHEGDSVVIYGNTDQLNRFFDLRI